MATTSIQQAPTSTGAAFQPSFKRVSQGEDRHADIYAVIATLVGNDKTVDDIRKQAETFGLPKTGPYHAYLDGTLPKVCSISPQSSSNSLVSKEIAMQLGATI